MCIVCDLRSTIMPPMLNPFEDYRHPDSLLLLRPLAPVVHAGPTKTNREEDKDNA